MFDEVEPLIWGAKIFGGTSHNTKRTKIGIFYTFFMSTIIICIVGFSVYSDMSSLADMKSFILMITRSGLCCSCFLIDVIITIYSNDRITSALDHLHVYDIFSKFHEKIHYPTLYYCRIILTIVLVCWIVVGYVVCQIDGKYPIFNGFSYAFVYGGISMQILKFVGLILLLHARFNHLSELVLPKGKK